MNLKDDLRGIAKGFKDGLGGQQAKLDRQSKWEAQPLVFKLVELALVAAAVLAYLALFVKG